MYIAGDDVDIAIDDMDIAVNNLEDMEDLTRMIITY